MKEKKYRVIFPNGKKVDFGAYGYSDFTLHENPLRMRRYVGRHGGIIKKNILEMSKPSDVLKSMRSVTKSKKEDWSIKGIYTPGFWSRWLLWSEPSLKKAKALIKKKFNLKLT